LNVDAADLLEGTSGSSGVGDELCDDGELLGSVDLHARAVEALVTHAVRIEIAAVGVADGTVAVVGLTSGT